MISRPIAHATFAQERQCFHGVTWQVWIRVGFSFGVFSEASSLRLKCFAVRCFVVFCVGSWFGVFSKESLAGVNLCSVFV